MYCRAGFHIFQEPQKGQPRRVIFVNDRFEKVGVISSAYLEDFKLWHSGMWRVLERKNSIDFNFPVGSVSPRIHLIAPDGARYTIKVTPDKDVYYASEIREVQIPVF